MKGELPVFQFAAVLYFNATVVKLRSLDGGRDKADFIAGCYLFVLLPMVHFYLTALCSCLLHKIIARGRQRP